MHNSDDIKKLIRKIGQGPTKILLEALAKNKQFEAAISTPIGVEILSDINVSIKDRMSLIIDEKDDEKTRAELRAYVEILNKWSARITSADNDLLKFNRIIEGN